MHIIFCVSKIYNKSFTCFVLHLKKRISTELFFCSVCFFTLILFSSLHLYKFLRMFFIVRYLKSLINSWDWLILYILNLYFFLFRFIFGDKISLKNKLRNYGLFFFFLVLFLLSRSLTGGILSEEIKLLRMRWSKGHPNLKKKNFFF